MKKLALFAAVAASLFATSAADAQSDTTTKTSRTTHRTTITARNNASVTARLRRIEAQARTFQATPRATRIDGSVTRAARSGNPLQMINPFAPKEYGDGTDVTRHEPDDAFQRPEGLKLFAVEF